MNANFNSQIQQYQQLADQAIALAKNIETQLACTMDRERFWPF